MKRAFLFPAVFVLGVLATRAVAQSDSPKPSSYEYRVFLVDAREFRDKDDWKEIVAKEEGNEFKADPAFKAYILNHLAKEGWELVQVAPAAKDKPEIVHLYLRRPRSR
jgi:hypothetical protein